MNGQVRWGVFDSRNRSGGRGSSTQQFS